MVSIKCYDFKWDSDKIPEKVVFKAYNGKGNSAVLELNKVNSVIPKKCTFDGFFLYFADINRQPEKFKPVDLSSNTFINSGLALDLSRHDVELRSLRDSTEEEYQRLFPGYKLKLVKLWHTIFKQAVDLVKFEV